MINQQPILIVDDEPDILSLLEIIIESEFDHPILKARNVKEAQSIYQEADNLLMMISDYSMEFGTGGDLYNFNLQHRNLPFVLMTAEFIDELPEFKDISTQNPLNTYLEKPADEEHILDAIRRVRKTAAPELGEIDEENKGLKRLQLIYFKQFYKNPSDLYIQLTSGKTIQIAKKENSDQTEIINHYIEKGVDYVLLPEKDYRNFLNDLKEALSPENLSDGPKEKVIDFMGLTYSLSREHVKALGVSSMHVDLVNQSLSLVVKELAQNKDIFDMLSSFCNRQDYLVDHSFLNIYFSSYILTKLGWANEQTMQQIAYAAFFHDLTLEDPELARIEDPDTIEDYRVQDLVIVHPEKSAELLDAIKGINFDARKIILDHHERPDGKGFPHGLTAQQLPPLSCTFLISHQIVDFLIDNQFRTTKLATFFQEMEGIWDQGNFKRPFECARQILLN
jgi:response regulator RpfG family c-di-GMP phosphodiesterase